MSLFTIAAKSWWDQRQASRRAAMAVLLEMEINQDRLEAWLKLLDADDSYAAHEEVESNLAPLSTLATEDALRTAALANRPIVEEMLRRHLYGWQVANIEVEHRRQLKLKVQRIDAERRAWNARVRKVAKPCLAAIPTQAHIIRHIFGLKAREHLEKLTEELKAKERRTLKWQFWRRFRKAPAAGIAKPEPPNSSD